MIKAKSSQITVMTMLCSMLLLLAFVTQWLFSQYQQQQLVLKQELQFQLAEVEKNTLDSVIFLNLVNPFLQENDSLQKAKKTTITQKEISTGSDGRTKTIVRSWSNSDSSKSISFNLSDSNSQEWGTKRKYPSGFKKGSNISINISDTSSFKTIFSTSKGRKSLQQNDSLKFTIDLDSEKDLKEVSAKLKGQVDSNFVVLMQGIKVLAKGLHETQLIGNDDKLFTRTDTNLLKQNFAQLLQKQEKKFDLKWANEKQLPKQSLASIQLVSSPLMLNDTPNKSVLVVGHIVPYLLLQLLPQFGFALLLVGLVAGSFYLAFYNMRKQEELAAIKNSLISNISHELKTPISTVKVAVEALQNFNVLQNPDQSKEYLAMAEQELNRLDLLVNQVLNNALFEQGKISFHKEKHDLQYLVAQTLSHLKAKFDAAQVSIEYESIGDNFTANIDVLHIQGVIINLLDNCLKYAAAGKKVIVLLESNAHTLRLSITDFGPGIPVAYRQKVFDKFFRVPQGNTHNVKGYGLGLSYAQDVIKQHDGMLTLLNKNEQGCTFLITLNHF